MNENPNTNIQRSVETSYDWRYGLTVIGNYVWDPIGLAWVKETQPGGGGGGGGTSSSFGAPFPASGTAAGAKDNLGNMAALNVDASGFLKVVSAGGGSAVTIADGADVAEGTTTDVKVIDDNPGTISAKLRGLAHLLYQVWDAGANVSNLRVILASNSVNISSQGAHAFSEDTYGPTNLVNVNDQLNIGAPSNAAGGAAIFEITGTWVGTIAFLGTLQDGSTTAVSAVNLASGAIGISTTGNGLYRISTGGLFQVVARRTIATSGTATVAGREATFYSGNTCLDQPLPIGSNVIGQVTANAGTNLNTSALALEAGGNLASIKTDVDKIPADPAREGGVLAKDASLTTIDTDIKAAQPRKIQDSAGGTLTSTGNALDVNIKSPNPLPVSSSAANAPTRSDTYTILASGTTVTILSGAKSFAIQVKGTAAVPTTWDIRLEGSLDNVNFSTILQHTNATGDGAVLWSGAPLSPVIYFRSRVAGLVLGGATNIVVTILGMP